MEEFILFLWIFLSLLIFNFYTQRCKQACGYVFFLLLGVSFKIKFQEWVCWSSFMKKQFSSGEKSCRRWAESHRARV